jgi:hypothetical protein
VQISRFAGQSNPEATAAPQQNAPSCGCLQAQLLAASCMAR